MYGYIQKANRRCGGGSTCSLPFPMTIKEFPRPLNTSHEEALGFKLLQLKSQGVCVRALQVLA